MATILEFRSGMRAEPYSPEKHGRRHASAEIVFFPGVRYERSQGAPSQEKPKRRSKKRDKIELRD